MSNEPDVSAVTCRLCDAPEVVGAALMDHLRLFHPDYHDAITDASEGRHAVAADPAPDAVFSYPVMRAADLEPFGVRCEDCDRLFGPGDPYAERLTGMIAGIPVVGVVCVPCAEAS